jgi:hypothetical protein
VPLRGVPHPGGPSIISASVTRRDQALPSPVVGGLVLSFEDETVRRRSPDDGCLHRRARLLIPRRAEPARRLGATLDQAEAADVVDGL